MMDSEVIVGLFTLGGTLLEFLTNYINNIDVNEK